MRHRHHHHGHEGHDDGGRWAAGRHGHRGHRHGWGGHHGRGMGGMGDDDMMRGRRMMGQGDLRLIVLTLIAEQPRHGYDIIKVLEERTADWYSPSPGIVYPTLTFLEEAGYLASQTEGAKKLYAMTDEGRAHLTENQAQADALMQRITFIGERARSIRERLGGDREERCRGLPQLVRAALDNLRDVAAERLDSEADDEARVVEVLARAAGELRRKN